MNNTKYNSRKDSYSGSVVKNVNGFNIEQRIRDACMNHEFVGIVCDDNHEHTIKAFNNICITPFDDFDDELDNQIHYCKKISKGFDIEILTASTKEEAVDVGILEEETYFTK